MDLLGPTSSRHVAGASFQELHVLVVDDLGAGGLDID